MEPRHHVHGVINTDAERDRADHAACAVRAGIEVRDHVEQNAFEGQRLHCMIGINTGPVVAGNVGARDRLHFTVQGDTVNTAACLEKLNKELGTSLLISASTAELVRSEGVPLHAIGQTRIRGKRAAIGIFEIPARPPDQQVKNGRDA